MTVNIDLLLKKAVQMKASDLHIKAGNPPVVRVDGTLKAMPAEQKLTPEDTSSIATAVLKEALREQFKRNREIDTSYSVKGLGRFRCNCYVQRGTIVIVFRVIPVKILSIEELELPTIINKISLEPRGLILVTGTTGSGKTTTLASMIDYMNQNLSDNIITIEDPVEFLHRDNKCIISQRELGTDTASFAKALRSSLRQDPDIILVGEMRDFETIQTALIAAETGHLVLSTLHTADTVETVNRIISVFPPYQQKQVRAQLASVLRAIISMRLVPKSDGVGRVPAVEVLIATAIIRSCIEDPDKTRLIHDHISQGVSQYGMQTFDQSLLDLFQKGLITYEDAVSRASNADDFALKVKGVQSTQDVYRTDGKVAEEPETKATPDIERFSS
jgi:twitching motility protein PilT